MCRDTKPANAHTPHPRDYGHPDRGCATPEPRAYWLRLAVPVASVSPSGATIAATGTRATTCSCEAELVEAIEAFFLLLRLWQRLAAIRRRHLFSRSTHRGWPRLRRSIELNAQLVELLQLCFLVCVQDLQ